MLFFSCKEKLDYKQDFSNLDGFSVLKINHKLKEKFIKESEYIDSVNLIPLETNEDCIIGEISKMEIDNNYIYILDSDVAKTLFVFKKNGEFLRKIGAKGNGPGEYTSIWDFKLLSKNKLMILDFTNNKLLFYKNFVYTHTEMIDYPIESVIKDKSYYYFKLTRYKTKASFGLLITNDKFETQKIEFQYPQSNKNPYFIPYSFRKYMDSITYIQQFESKIYRIKDGKILPKYYIDFGDKKLSYEDAIFSNVKDWKKENVMHLTGDFYENKSFLIFNFSDNGYINTGLYNKKTKQISYSKYFLPYIEKLSTEYIDSNDSFIYGAIVAEKIAYLDKTTKEKFGLTDVKETDNPIISISYFKD